jgi:aryl-alcohol dehydrogenase-like predicted oxidoreductase
VTEEDRPCRGIVDESSSRISRISPQLNLIFDTGETDQMTPPLNRRDFLAQASATAALAATASAAAPAALAGTVRAKNALPKSPTDKVTLGKTGIQVSLVGMGTGSVGSGQASNQTRLGVQGFTKVVRHALDRGICFFDVADQYGSHTYLREALKGVPRDQYVIQTKTHATNVADARSHVERYRMELGVDYIDILLLHCMTKKGWPAENQGSMEYLMRAKEEKLIRAHGTSCHGMDPLHTSAKNPFVEVDLARINPEGLIMDDRKPDEVASVLEEMHNAGKGIVGMKILGEGRINTPERKDASLRYVLGLGTVNAFIIGFESPDQIDDLLKRTADAIASLKA